MPFFLAFLAFLLPQNADLDSVQLGYRFKVGDRMIYRETTEIVMLSDFFHGGRRESRLACTKTEEVKEVLQNGNGRILITIDDVQSWGPGVSEFSLIAAIEKKPILIEIAPNGQIVSITPEDPATPLEYSGVTLRRLLERRFHLMPTKVFKRGESWDKERVFSTDHPTVSDVDQVVDLHYTLADSLQSHGHVCTKVVYSGTVLGTLKQGEMGSFEGQLEGYFLWQPDIGRELLEIQSHETTFHIASPEGNYQYQVKIDTTRRFLESGVVESFSELH